MEAYCFLYIIIPLLLISSYSDQVSVIPLVGSQPSTSIITNSTERAHTVSGTRLRHRSSSTIEANTSNLFTVKPVRPKTAGKNLKRDGATAPSPSILTPLSSELMHSSYQSSSNYEGDEEKDEDSAESSSLPSLTRLTKCEQSALKLPRPPAVSTSIGSTQCYNYHFS